MTRLSSLFMLLVLTAACNKKSTPLAEPVSPPVSRPGDTTFIRGADLSYVNEMIDCGAVYYDAAGLQTDPYKIFANAGASLVRVRLWHRPDWTNYSHLEDVKKTIGKAKALNRKVLLDFHYSDDWADPAHQTVPAAWSAVVNNPEILGDSIYNYTYRILDELHRSQLLPDMVQTGNEINSEILQDPKKTYNNINWPRNAALIRRAIEAVRKFSADKAKPIAIMLHIAQPENTLWWFEQARQNGISDYDWIGFSYYPAWSTYQLQQLPEVVKTLKSNFQKRVMVAETAYPFTQTDIDGANNILGANALISGFPATPTGQYEYLKALEKTLKDAGAEGLLYWEPAWVSTNCSTRWGKGSHWDNAVLFDNNYRALPAMQFFSGK